jgi:membrane-associated phospholipid phosphatase
MYKKINEIISVLFHPVFCPLAVIQIGLQIGFDDSLSNHIDWFFILILSTIICPFLMLIFLKKMNVISSITLKNRNDRIFPLLGSVFFLMIGFYLLNNQGLPYLLNIYYISGVTLALLTTVISMIYKISLHMTSIGLVYGSVLYFSAIYNSYSISLIIIVLLLSVIIGLSRLNLFAHSFSQLISGFILGVLSVLFVLFFTH